MDSYENLKAITAYGIQFLKYKYDATHIKTSPNGIYKCQEIVINSSPIGNIIIEAQTQTLGRIWADVTPTTFLKLVNKYDISVFEIIHKFPYKAYLDVDKYEIQNTHGTSYLEHILTKINEIFPDSDIAVSGSSSVKSSHTTSYLIII